MNTRTGLQALAKIIKAACKLLAVWSGSIMAAIDASTLSVGDKDKLKDSIVALNGACAIASVLLVKLEQ